MSAGKEGALGSIFAFVIFHAQRSSVSSYPRLILRKSGYPSTRQLAASLPLTPIRPFGRCRTATFVQTNALGNLEYPSGTNAIGIAPLYAAEDATIEVFPEDVPNAQIAVYRYEPAITDKDNKISIPRLAKCLLESCKAYCKATRYYLNRSQQ
ncbi:unnamed protein product [Clonostachys rhizophaga]|uniref:Uncharacterized protein n=1 Tax=Clonostachys rhizophaga TaxID=160324 RepID=A0A9N9W2F8_9HYPO|nr:unnamed protein product [Clonostachys rhizophaga]